LLGPRSVGCVRGWLGTTVALGSVATAVIISVIVVVWICLLPIRLLKGRAIEFQTSDLLLEGLALFALVLSGSGILIARDMFIGRRKRRRVRRSELERGNARTIRAKAERAWFQSIAIPGDRDLILKVGPDELLVITDFPPPGSPPPTEIGRDICLNQLPQSGDLISFEATGDPVPVEYLADDIVPFSHGGVEGLVPVARATPEFRKLLAR
jgi:hypothetical protein